MNSKGKEEAHADVCFFAFTSSVGPGTADSKPQFLVPVNVTTLLLFLTAGPVAPCVWVCSPPWLVPQPGALQPSPCGVCTGEPQQWCSQPGPAQEERISKQASPTALFIQSSLESIHRSHSKLLHPRPLLPVS